MPNIKVTGKFKPDGLFNIIDTGDANNTSTVPGIGLDDALEYLNGLSQQLTADELAAIQGANNPSATNVFATIDDIAPGSSLIERVHYPALSPNWFIQPTTVTDGFRTTFDVIAAYGWYVGLILGNDGTYHGSGLYGRIQLNNGAGVQTAYITTVGGDDNLLTQPLKIIGGFKDANVSTAINLGDGSNTSFTTTNKTIVGAVNEVNAKPTIAGSFTANRVPYASGASTLTDSQQYSIDNSNINASKYIIKSPDGTRSFEFIIDQNLTITQIYSSYAVDIYSNGSKAATFDTTQNFVLTGGFKDANVTTAIKLGDVSNTAFNTTNKTIVGSVNEVNNSTVHISGAETITGVKSFTPSIIITGGLKDANVTTAINLGDISNTSFNTTNKTIVGAVNELTSASNVLRKDKFTTTIGQTSFTTSVSPKTILGFCYNGVFYIDEGVDFTHVGTSFTWINSSISFAAGDKVFITYF
jgi:hypothetical protein